MLNMCFLWSTWWRRTRDQNARQTYSRFIDGYWCLCNVKVRKALGESRVTCHEGTGTHEEIMIDPLPHGGPKIQGVG